jgi:hypothetical protein
MAVITVLMMNSLHIFRIARDEGLKSGTLYIKQIHGMDLFDRDADEENMGNTIIPATVPVSEPSSDDDEAEIAREYATLQSTVMHFLQFHSNKATEIVDDIRDFTRPWRRRLRDILFRENEKYVKFLQKSPDEWPAVEYHTSFFNELGRQTTSLGTSWIEKHVNPVIDKDSILAEIDAECVRGSGDERLTLGGLRKQITHLMDNYLATLNKIFQFHAALDYKITQMTRLKSQIEGMDFLDGDASEEAKELQVSALKFLQSKYRALGVGEDYVGFCKEYARFQAYRSVLGAVQAGSDMHGVPICSICASGTVVSALIPCGHVYCNTCTQKQRSQCYICRTTVKGTLRIYFN